MSRIINYQPERVGTDWSKKIPKAASGGTSSNSYVDLLNVTGAGFLTGVSQLSSSSASGGSVQIIIDGITIIDGLFSYGSGGTAAFDAIHRFNSSLSIKHKSNNSWTVFTMVAYVLD